MSLAANWIETLSWIQHMEKRYQTLITLYQIVKNDSQPEKYGCRPREIILRQLEDWGSIQDYLTQLNAEGLVIYEQQATLIIYITSAGIEKALSLINEKSTA
jgi:hypothetical protein